MTEAPERIITSCQATRDGWYQTASSIEGSRGWRGTQYVRADLADAWKAERDSFRAVLEGASYGDIDGIAKSTVGQSRALGEIVKAATLDMIRRALEAEAEVEVLREALTKKDKG